MYAERTWNIDPDEFCIIENVVVTLEPNTVYRPRVVNVTKNAKFEIKKVTINGIAVDSGRFPNFEFSIGLSKQ